ncbi:filamentous hemagglutinin N-terminal domain-containing protein [Roseobacter sp. HKCCA0434]|uniref:two-partner secretion domain-containing protein n=1 Tax=Roseobacter sp. HKCCA0434 TaxID=3079297 RepID=UPI00290586E9|nr:filamentous hemagglutinin N-terminal domain-containing protein [Roseobacter sp. HKCCA0434]
MISLRLPSRGLVRKVLHGFVTLISSVSVVASSVSVSYAQTIIVDPSAPGSSFLQSSNGTPQINIETPQSGVSLNRFDEFSIGDDGVILNNATSGGVSVIGQNVTANPNLMVSGPASTIVAEVTGAAPSNMTGTTEVFGTQASVIIANPNGIVCNGCDFLNTTSSTLTTGRPIVNGPDVDLAVTEGTVTIGPDGFQPGAQGGVIGRHVVLTGPIVTSGQGAENDLLVSGGAQRVQGLDGADLSSASIVAAPSTVSRTSPFAIDAGENGRLEGGDVVVRNTEIGQGVNLYGAVDGRSLTASSGGNLFYRDARIDGTVSLSGDELRQYGTLGAGGDVRINGRAFTLYDGRVIETSGDIEISGEEFVVIAGEVSGGNIEIDVSAGTLTNTGFLMADGDLTVVAGEDFRQQRQIASEYDTAIDPALQNYIDAYLAQLAAGGPEADIAAEMIARAGAHELVAEYADQGATSTGTQVSIDAVGGSILNIGGAIAGTDDVTLAADIDVINRSLSLRRNGTCDGSDCGPHMEFHSAEILSGGTLTAIAGNDIRNEASNIGAASDIVLSAGRDIVITLDNSEVKTHTSDSSGYVTEHIDAVLQPAQVLSLLGDVNLEAGRGVQIIGSLVSAGGTLEIDSGNYAWVHSRATNDSYDLLGLARQNYCQERYIPSYLWQCVWILDALNSSNAGAFAVLSAENILVSAENNISISAPKIESENSINIISESGDIRISDMNQFGSSDRSVDDFAEISGRQASELFSKPLTDEEEDSASDYLMFLQLNELMTAVEALRRADGGTDIKESARTVGAQSYTSLVDDAGSEAASAVAAALETDWDMHEADLAANQAEISGIHDDFRTGLAALVADLEMPDEARQRMLDEEIEKASIYYNERIENENILHQYRLDSIEAQHQSLVDIYYDAYIVYGQETWNYVHQTLIDNKNYQLEYAIIQYDEQLNYAASDLQYEIAQARVRIAEIDFEADLVALRQEFDAQRSQLQSSYAELSAQRDQALQAGLRNVEAVMQAQAEIDGLRSLAVARDSVDIGAESLARALTDQAFPDLMTADISTVLPALSDNSAERDAFLSATAQHFSTGANAAGLLFSEFPSTQMIANGDGLSLSAAGVLRLEEAYLSTDGHLNLSTLGDLTLHRVTANSNSVGGTMALTAGEDIEARGTSIQTAGDLLIRSGLGDVDFGATPHAYDRVTGYDNVVGVLSDGIWNTDHHLLSQELSTLHADGDLIIHAGAGLEIDGLSEEALAQLTRGNLILGGVGGTIGGDAILTANRDIGFLAPRSEIAYSTGDSRNGTNMVDIQPHVTDLSVAGNFTASAGNNMLLEGTIIDAGGTLDLSAEHDIMLSAAQEIYQYNSRSYSRKWYRKKRTSRSILTITHDGTDLLSGLQMDIESQTGDLILAGSSLISEGGDINLSATEGNILVGAFTDVHQDQRRKSRSYLGGLISSSSSSFRDIATSTGSSLLAELDLNILSGGNTELVGAQLSAGHNLNFDVGGDLHVRAAIGSVREESFSSNTGLVLATTETERSNRETAVLTTMSANGDISFSVGGDTYLTLYNSPDQQSLSVAELYPEELEALAGLILLDQDLLDEYFHDETKTLSPAFTMVLTVALTSGFGSVLANAGVQGLTVTNAATGVTSLTNAGRAVASLAASTTVGIANGTVSGELDFEEILRNAAVSAGTSYLANSINLQALGQGELGLEAGAQGQIARLASGEFDGLTLFSGGWDPSMTTSVFGSGLTAANVLEGAFDASLTAGIQTVTNGGDFGEAFRGSFVSSVVALGLADAQTGIGDIFAGEHGGEGSLGHVLLHGLAGCAAAELQGADCSAGAAGGIAGAIYAGGLENTELSDEQQRQRAELIGAVSGWMFSGGAAENVAASASTALSSMINNRQLHENEKEILSDMLGRPIDDADFDMIDTVSSSERETLAAACALIKCSAHLSVNHPNYTSRVALEREGWQNLAEIRRLMQAGNTLLGYDVQAEHGHLYLGGIVERGNVGFDIGAFLYTGTDARYDWSSSAGHDIYGQRSSPPQAFLDGLLSLASDPSQLWHGLVDEVQGTAEVWAAVFANADISDVGEQLALKQALRGMDYADAATLAYLNGGLSNEEFRQTLTDTAQAAVLLQTIVAGYAAGGYSLAHNTLVPRTVTASKLYASNGGVFDFDRGRTAGSYNALNPGPLDDSLAETFSGGRYNEVVLTEDVVLHRAGTGDRPLGQFFTQQPADSILKTRIDSAVLPTWPGGGTSPIDSTFEIRIPAGTSVYVGEVSSQGGVFVGGTQQIVVPRPWEIDGVEVLSRSPLP